MKATAIDGTVFRVGSGANGNYVYEDNGGSHRSSGGNGWWDKATMKKKLDEAVIRHDENQRMHDALPSQWLVEHIDPNVGRVDTGFYSKNAAIKFATSCGGKVRKR